MLDLILLQNFIVFVSKLSREHSHTRTPRCSTRMAAIFWRVSRYYFASVVEVTNPISFCTTNALLLSIAYTGAWSSQSRFGSDVPANMDLATKGPGQAKRPTGSLSMSSDIRKSMAVMNIYAPIPVQICHLLMPVKGAKSRGMLAIWTYHPCNSKKKAQGTPMACLASINIPHVQCSISHTA